MKKSLQALMSSQMSDWATPQSFFDRLNSEFGFTVDVCATEANTKVKDSFIHSNSLSEDWGAWNIDGRGRDRCFMNPPYGREIGKWIKKAFEEPCLVVALLPARTDTKWFHEYIWQKPNVHIRFLKGRLKFEGALYPAPFPSMVVIFGQHA